jgi:hypothetical protein
MLIVTPRYPWYALLLVPMIAATGRWEWLAVPLALTERLLIADVTLARITVGLAIVLIVAVSLHRAGPGAVGRLLAAPGRMVDDARRALRGRRTPHLPQ